MSSPSPSLNLTSEQREIINFHANSKQNLLVEALAGAAKTTTIVESIRHLPFQNSPNYLCLAFNVTVKETLSRKITRKDVTILTLNGLGHRAWNKFLGRGIKIDLQKYKSYQIISPETIHPVYVAQIRKLFNAARTFGLVPKGTIYPSKKIFSDTTENWQFLAEFCEIESAIESPNWAEENQEIIGLTRKCLIQSIDLAHKGQIDFADQLYMSTCFSGQFDSYTHIFVDEAQDLSALNHAMLRNIIGPSSRITAVGDKLQSIYAFRGSHGNSMEKLKTDFSMYTLPLTVCFRCSREVISLAKNYAPEIKSPPNQPIGSVEIIKNWDIQDITKNSTILCRNNAPLFSLFFKFLRRGVKVNFIGGNIADRIIRIIEKIDGDRNLPRLEILEEFEKYINKLPSEQKSDFFLDLSEVLSVTPGANTKEMIESLKSVMNADSGQINLSTIHRAKGMEWEKVFILDFWRIPSKYAKTPEQLAQERNLAYVAITRAIRDLKFIEMSGLTKYKSQQNQPQNEEFDEE